MADPKVFYDLTFRFSSGNFVDVTMEDGKDRIDDTDPELYRVTVLESPQCERTLTVHRSKLDAVECTKRIVQPQTEAERAMAEVAR